MLKNSAFILYFAIQNVILIKWGNNRDDFDQMFKRMEKQMDRMMGSSFGFETMSPMNFEALAPPKDLFDPHFEDPFKDFFFKDHLKDRIHKTKKIMEKDHIYKKLKDKHQKIIKKSEDHKKKLKDHEETHENVRRIIDKDKHTETIIKNFNDGFSIQMIQDRNLSPDIQVLVDELNKVAKPKNKEKKDKFENSLNQAKDLQKSSEKYKNVFSNLFTTIDSDLGDYESLIKDIHKNFNSLEQMNVHKLKDVAKGNNLLTRIDENLKKLEDKQSHMNFDNLKSIHQEQNNMVMSQNIQEKHLDAMPEVANEIVQNTKEKSEKAKKIIEKVENSDDISRDQKDKLKELASFMTVSE